jgi:hypothetical protein
MVQLPLLVLLKKTQLITDEFEIIEVVETEEVTSFTEIMPVTPPFRIKNSFLIVLKKMD